MTALGELRALGTGQRRHAIDSDTRDNRAAAGFLAPWLIGLLLITIGPMIASLYLAFTDYNLLENPRFIGTDNITQMLSDERLASSLGVTFTYVLVSLPIQLAVALALAVVLDRGLRGLAFYRSALYLPSLLGSSVAIAVLWRLVFGKEGLFNAFLGIFGIEGPSWVASPDTALGTIMALNVWTFGAPMVIFLAGLRQIPRQYYEASATDGAGKWRQFRSITLPLLSPIIFFNLVLGVIGSFQSFTQAFIVSGGTGGPADSTLFFSLYLYQEAFASFRMGYASALAWLLLLIIGASTAIMFWTSKWWVFYNE
ncbi:carbohydrate ABC transporter permease [Phytoactinopolyspora halotolerans]|uniref:Sugar ABC transporter permease n=1 Tax=Phytoactinopolyspora halotolerans TaxID=1981512 RepID=A0A6L9SDK5_9ACTN|nr:sugar ABC transporter permease [Phytoactinopolyspora halotolerans]NEE02674.1 sugar ABC transporter permease [Phytoactinopolyspora halotolerans]